MEAGTALVRVDDTGRVKETSGIEPALSAGLFRLLKLRDEPGPIGDLARALEMTIAGMGMPSDISKVVWSGLQMATAAMEEIFEIAETVTVDLPVEPGQAWAASSL